jgi:hypothetical protein
MVAAETNGSETASVITANRVRVVDDFVLVGSPRAALPRVEPRIRLIKEGEIIRALDVICGCGERIRVKCDYS